jgi:hypothetical protein
MPLKHIAPTAPVWIRSNGHDPSGEAYITIACPECLRTFPQPLVSSIHQIEETDCVHCSNPILYVVDRSTSQTCPQFL